MTQHLDIIICTEDATEEVGTARVEYRPWANEVILRDVDFTTDTIKTAVIMALQADVEYYARKATPKPTNAEKLADVYRSWCGGDKVPNSLIRFMDEAGVTAPEETK